jgi:hypothetical protein
VCFGGDGSSLTIRRVAWSESLGFLASRSARGYHCVIIAEAKRHEGAPSLVSKGSVLGSLAVSYAERLKPQAKGLHQVSMVKKKSGRGERI